MSKDSTYGPLSRLLRYPHHWFLVSVPLFYGFCIVASDDSVDIQLHDTMFVISNHIFYFAPAFLLFIWACLHLAVYKVQRQPANKAVSFMHLLITVIVPLLFLLPEPTQPQTRNYTNFESLHRQSWFIYAYHAMGAYVLSQLLFLPYLLFLLVKALVTRNK